MRFLTCVLLACACSSPSHQPDASPSAEDAGESPDGGSPDAGPPNFSTCEGTCRETALEVTLDGQTRPLTRAQFGVTAPERSESGQWELYVEAHAGGSSDCPDETSPTPDRTLVISGLELPADDSPQTKEDGVFAAFFDFDGELTEAPFLRAESVTVTPRAHSEEAFVAFALDAVLPGGRIEGHVFATHCASLDDR